MPFRIDNAIVLFGLFALAIPIVIHLLQRRRHDTLDWGAMQFLPDSIATQRRRWLDEILLLLLRMAMIVLIVLALATPTSTSPWLANLGGSSTRDIVLVIDGSFSMGVRVPGRTTPWDEALRWSRDRIDGATSQDHFRFVVARQPPLACDDWSGVLASKPDGNPDLPRALAEAWQHLQTRSKASAKEIIVLTDGQLHGWADAASQAALENLGDQWRDERKRAGDTGHVVPTLRIVKVGGELPAGLANYALAPLTASRTVAKVGQKITVRSALHLENFAKFQPPRNVSVSINEVATQKLELPENVDLKKGQIPLVFQHRFEKAGPHVVALRVDEEDALAGDNEQQIAIDVVDELRVLCIDGDDQLSPESSSYFVQRALSANAVSWRELTERDLTNAAVVVLADVPRLEPAQASAIERFVADGGGLLIGAGERTTVDKISYSDSAWLPATIVDVLSSKNGVAPDARSFQHPALELFRAGDGAMKDARFPKWAKIRLDPRATLLATFNNGDPFLVEKKYKKGRVILCTAPFDRRWNTTFPSMWEFPVLMHEMGYYLAGTRATQASIVPDLRESDLTRCTAEDWRRLRNHLSAVWRDDEPATSAIDDAHREELWWLLLGCVVILLCMEVWMTRRLALARG